MGLSSFLITTFSNVPEISTVRDGDFQADTYCYTDTDILGVVCVAGIVSVVYSRLYLN